MLAGIVANNAHQSLWKRPAADPDTMNAAQRIFFSTRNLREEVGGDYRRHTKLRKPSE